MPLKFFAIPALHAGQAEADLNQFLRGHRVVAIERQFLAAGPTWCLAIEYLDQAVPGASGASDAARKTRIDYKEVLSPDEFGRFSKLRDLRKQIAEAEALPVYAVFTNEQLAAMAQRMPQTPAELQAIDGVGDAKMRQFGPRYLALLTSLAPVPGGVVPGAAVPQGAVPVATP